MNRKLNIITREIPYYNQPVQSNEERFNNLLKSVILSDHNIEDFEIGRSIAQINQDPGETIPDYRPIHYERNTYFDMTYKHDRSQVFRVQYDRESLYKPYIKLPYNWNHGLSPNARRDSDDNEHFYCGWLIFYQNDTNDGINVGEKIKEYLRKYYLLEYDKDYLFEEEIRTAGEYGYGALNRVFKINIRPYHRVYDEFNGYFLVTFATAPIAGQYTVSGPVPPFNMVELSHKYEEGKHDPSVVFIRASDVSEYFQNGKPVKFSFDAPPTTEGLEEVLVEMTDENQTKTITQVVEATMLERYGAVVGTDYYHDGDGFGTVGSYREKPGIIKVRIDPVYHGRFRGLSRDLPVRLTLPEGIDLATYRENTERNTNREATFVLDTPLKEGEVINDIVQQLYDRYHAVAYLDYNIEGETLVISKPTIYEDFNKEHRLNITSVEGSRVFRNDGTILCKYERVPKKLNKSEVPGMSGVLHIFEVTQDSLVNVRDWSVRKLVWDWFATEFQIDSDYIDPENVINEVSPELKHDLDYARAPGDHRHVLTADDINGPLFGRTTIIVRVEDSNIRPQAIQGKLFDTQFRAENFGGYAVKNHIIAEMRRRYTAEINVDYELPDIRDDTAYYNYFDITLRVVALSGSFRLVGEGTIALEIIHRKETLSGVRNTYTVDVTQLQAGSRSVAEFIQRNLSNSDPMLQAGRDYDPATLPSDDVLIASAPETRDVLIDILGSSRQYQGSFTYRIVTTKATEAAPTEIKPIPPKGSLGTLFFSQSKLKASESGDIVTSAVERFMKQVYGLTYTENWFSSDMGNLSDGNFTDRTPPFEVGFEVEPTGHGRREVTISILEGEPEKEWELPDSNGQGVPAGDSEPSESHEPPATTPKVDITPIDDGSGVMYTNDVDENHRPGENIIDELITYMRDTFKAEPEVDYTTSTKSIVIPGDFRYSYDDGIRVTIKAKPESKVISGENIYYYRWVGSYLEEE